MNISRLRQGVNDLFQVHAGDEVDLARFRAHQLQALLSISPAAMSVNLVSALMICWALWAQVSHALLLPWAVCVISLALWGLRGWWGSVGRPPRPTASPRVLRRAAVLSGLVALAWGAVPALVFADVDAQRQFFVGMVTVGFLCGGGFVLSSLPVAGTVYVALIAVGGAIGLLRTPEALGMLPLLLAFAVMVVLAIWGSARAFGARFLAEARADRNSEVIRLLLRDFEDHASDLLWEVDAAGHLVHVSQRLAGRLAIAPARLLRLRALALLRLLCPPDDEAQQHLRALRSCTHHRRPFRDQIVALHAGSMTTWWSLTAKPLVGPHGVHEGWRGVATDITDRQIAHRRLRWLAHNDALTGLHNRTHFREVLQSMLRNRRAEGGGPAPLAVIVMDLDGFKQINDTLGHAAGDGLLLAFGRKLQGVLRRSDSLARLGGDEFAMVVRGVHRPADLQPMLERLMVLLQEPEPLAGRTVFMRTSIGVAMAPVDGHDVDELMNHADAAMYAAKRQGGSRWVFFHAGLAEANRRRTKVVQALRGAVERGEFRLHFQPQVSAVDGHVHGFEALLRWRHPELGEVSPVEFIAIAEGSGLMGEIGGWVLVEACRQAATWPSHVKVAINVSATQLGASDFVQRVEAASSRLARHRIELEVTESALIDDIDSAIQTLELVRSLGCRIGLDDFGTGYSALSYLRRIQFDTLKIDRSFVSDLTRDDGARVIVDTILAMTRALGVVTVAEGVEMVAEADMLGERSCELLQGYLYSRPMPAGDVVPFLAQWRSRTRDTRPLALA